MSHLTAHIDVVEGCQCPDHVPPYRCFCRDAKRYRYMVEPCFSDDPEGAPHPVAVADIIRQHPGATYIFLNSKIYGGESVGEHWGETVMDRAVRLGR